MTGNSFFLNAGSLTVRFTFFVVMVTLVSGLVLGGLAGLGGMRDEVNRQYVIASQRLDFLERPASFALYHLDHDTITALLQGLKHDPVYRSIEVFSDQGRSFGRIHHSPPPPSWLTTLLRQTFFDDISGKRSSRLSHTPPLEDADTVHVGRLQAELNLDHIIHRATGTLFNTFWVTGIQALLMGVLGAGVFYAAVGRPLQTITRTIRHHARKGQPFAPLELDVSSQELKQLVSHYNEHAHRGERYLAELTEANRVLDEQTRRDPLTLDYNRRELVQRLTRRLFVLNPNERLALVVWDIDGFARVNDRYGQDAGDAALKVISRHLNQSFHHDEPLYRLQADTFAMCFVLSHAGSEEPLTERLIQKLHVETTLEADTSSSALELTLSAGMALAPEHATTPESLLRAAQLGLADAKNAGKHCLRSYSAATDERQRRKVAALLLLKQRLADKDFTLAYQPKVCLQDGSLKGCEALFRLRENADSAPWELLQEAEATGLIVPLGHAILEHALNDFAPLLPSLDPEFRLAVNISPRQLTEPGFCDRLNRLLSHYRFPPEHLELEITEATPLINNRAFMDNHRRLRDTGVSFSLDDFGTGYASIEYLLFIGFDFLKIDRQFVKDLPGDTNSLRVCRAVLALASELGCRTVIEGIETPEQQALMQEHRATLGQGYLYARPLPLDAFRKYCCV